MENVSSFFIWPYGQYTYGNSFLFLYITFAKNRYLCLKFSDIVFVFLYIFIIVSFIFGIINLIPDWFTDAEGQILKTDGYQIKECLSPQYEGPVETQIRIFFDFHATVSDHMEEGIFSSYDFKSFEAICEENTCSQSISYAYAIFFCLMVAKKKTHKK